MYNSTIISKKEWLDCGCYNFNFSKRRCKFHATLEDSKKRIENSKKEYKSIINHSLWDAGKEKWFSDRRKEMNGLCDCGCGRRSSKDDNKYFKYSCCHVLAKKNFDSISLHPANCIELAFWGGCHSILDDKGYEYCKQTKPFLWDLIVKKFLILFPCIAPEEHKFIPDILLAEFENNILNEII